MNLLLIFSVTFLVQFLIGFEASFISPIIPYLSDYFGIEESSVLYLNMGFSLIGILSPFFGMFADKFGKKKIMIYALMSFLLGTIITGWSPSPLIFALGRMLIGAGNVTLAATLLSYISDFVPYGRRGRAAGILRISFAVSILLSPMYSSIMVKYLNIHYLYWSVSILSLIILLLTFLLPKDENEDQDGSSGLDFKELVSMIRNPLTMEFLLAQFFLVISPIVMFGYLSIWLKNSLSLGQENIGYIFSLTAVGTVIGVVLSASLSDKVGKMRFTKISFIVMTLALAPLAYLKSIYIVIPITLLYAIGLDGGWGAFQTVCSEVYPKRRTVFMTLLYFTNSICSILFTAIGPSLFNYGGYKLMIWIATITSVFSLVIFSHISANDEVKSRLEAK